MSDRIATLYNHEREPHCCGCYVVGYSEKGFLTAICNECGYQSELLSPEEIATLRALVQQGVNAAQALRDWYCPCCQHCPCCQQNRPPHDEDCTLRDDSEEDWATIQDAWERQVQIDQFLSAALAQGFEPKVPRT